ncbi:MAG: aldo/keto reductase [Dehalococcoidia bacterium]|nr:aldo/keto reductase [Dehalococcoidia bacterium]
MKYIMMGTQKVSAVGLGAWQFGEPGWGWGKEIQHEDALWFVHRAIELGINFFDTAAIYGNGKSEEILGEALEGRRHEAVVATKVAPPLHPDRVKWAAERSLRRLNMSSVDLYQLHVPDNRVPIDQTMDALRELMSEGQIHQVGVSNFGPSHWRRAEAALGSPVISNQVEYHLLERRYANGLFPHAHQEGRVIIAFSPLAQGLLSGKYNSGNIPDDLRANFGIFNRDNLRRAPAIVDVLRSVGQQYGATPAQVALAWLLRDPTVMVIPGVRSLEQLEANAAAADLELSEEDARRIDEVSMV